ncbi:MAG: glycine zipper 2TM domain-containing protein [Verrucomicrobiota bacterium]
MTFLRLLTMVPLTSAMLLSSCVVAPYGPGCAYHQPCGYPGGGYGGYAPPAQGTVGGALLGATAGGIIGHQSGRGLEGAALGGVLGALAGRVMETSRQDTYYQPAYYNPPQPVYDEPDYGYDDNDPYAY